MTGGSLVRLVFETEHIDDLSDAIEAFLSSAATLSESERGFNEKLRDTIEFFEDFCSECDLSCEQRLQVYKQSVFEFHGVAWLVDCSSVVGDVSSENALSLVSAAGWDLRWVLREPQSGKIERVCQLFSEREQLIVLPMSMIR